jgi:Zn2+/Cd2+-exporting ATPase
MPATRPIHNDQHIYNVPAMDCPSCVTHIEDALRDKPGVSSVDVNLVERTVQVHGDNLDREELTETLRRAGYPPTPPSATSEDTPPPVWATQKAIRTYVAGSFWLVSLIADLTGWGASSALQYVWHTLALTGAVLGAYNFVPSAIRSVLARRIDIDVLMTVALTGAMALGEFVEAAAIGALFSLAELLETQSMARARDALHSLMNLSPPTARVKDGLNGTVEKLIDDIHADEVQVVRPGELIPLDGIVTQGVSGVNEAALTGEPMPVRREIGDEVFAGTLTVDGYLEIRTTREAENTVLARVVSLVRSAQSKKARTERVITRFSRYYTPAVIVIATIFAIAPPLLGMGDWHTWILRGLTLLVVSCPCALVISTPVSVVSAITSAARHGVVITGGEYLEALGEVRAIAFDKTGTLTHGTPEVVAFSAVDGTDERDVIRIAEQIENHIAHPIAHAIVAYARSRDIETDDAQVSDVEQLPGRGVSAQIHGKRHVAEVADDDLPDDMAALRSEGMTVVRIARGESGSETVLGYAALADQTRPTALNLAHQLRKSGIQHTVLITGDTEQSAHRVTEEAGIDEFAARCLPHDKVEVIERLRQQYGSVAMVGDGINDAPALASATVGIAMGVAGSPTALDAADVALVSDDLSLLPYLVSLARKARNIIRQNIAVSLGVKLLMIIGVPFGFVSMAMAVLVGDMGTSLAVTTNALRLIRERPKSDRSDGLGSER